MSEQISFLNMFSQYQPPEPLRSVLSQAALVAADIDPASRTVTAAVHSSSYIPKRLLDQVSSDVCAIYGLRRLELTASHPSDQLSLIEPDELMGLFVGVNSMTRGSLAGASWHWEERKLVIELKANGKAVANAKVILKVNKKKYTATTNSKGKATFKLKLTKKGKYNAKIAYNGDNCYSKASAKAKITVKR